MYRQVVIVKLEMLNIDDAEDIITVVPPVRPYLVHLIELYGRDFPPAIY